MSNLKYKKRVEADKNGERLDKAYYKLMKNAVYRIKRET